MRILMLYICCVSLGDTVIVGLWKWESRRQRDWSVCVCDNLIVYIWWDLKFRLVSLILALFAHARSLNPLKIFSRFCTQTHTHTSDSNLSSFPLKLFKIQTESAVISPPKWKENTQYPPTQRKKKKEGNRERWKEERGSKEKKKKKMKKNVWGRRRISVADYSTQYRCWQWRVFVSAIRWLQG